MRFSIAVRNSTPHKNFSRIRVLLLLLFASSVSSSVELCELPPCQKVLQSRLHSERCGTKAEGWPLLVTGTPRSATVYATELLKSYGMQIQNDWANPSRDGSVSWIFAFEDANNFGPARTLNKTYGHVFHQIKEPLGSITSMCTEPIFTDELSFLRRHINLTSSEEDPRYKSRGALEFWVNWHTYLVEMQFPTYQIEQVQVEDIFRLAGLEHLYKELPNKSIPKTQNSRHHRPKFTWQELYTIDPQNAAKAWELAHQLGYSYPDIDFNNFTCLDELPMCNEEKNVIPPSCPAGTHPYPEGAIANHQIRKLDDISGVKGWVNAGCVEYKLNNGTFVGVSGVQAKDENITDEIVVDLLLKEESQTKDDPNMLHGMVADKLPEQEMETKYGSNATGEFFADLPYKEELRSKDDLNSTDSSPAELSMKEADPNIIGEDMLSEGEISTARFEDILLHSDSLLVCAVLIGTFVVTACLLGITYRGYHRVPQEITT